MTHLERCRDFLKYLVSVEEYETAGEISNLIKELEAEEKNKS